MLNDPLPKQVDVRKLVVKGAEIKALEPVANLPRFASVLANDSGSITIELQFCYDEDRHRKIEGNIEGTVQVTCQRCLEAMPVTIKSTIDLGIVWSEEDSQRLPASLDPIIVGEELTDLSDMVEEELILNLPFVNYHELDQCKREASYTSSDEEAIAVEEPKDNPFNVLESLKSNTDH